VRRLGKGARDSTSETSYSEAVSQRYTKYIEFTCVRVTDHNSLLLRVSRRQGTIRGWPVRLDLLRHGKSPVEAILPGHFLQQLLSRCNSQLCDQWGSGDSLHDIAHRNEVLGVCVDIHSEETIITGIQK
jgi:hypothetical protein